MFAQALCAQLSGAVALAVSAEAVSIEAIAGDFASARVYLCPRRGWRFGSLNPALEKLYFNHCPSVVDISAACFATNLMSRILLNLLFLIWHPIKCGS